MAQAVGRVPHCVSSEAGHEEVEEDEHDDEDAPQELGIAEPFVGLARLLALHLIVEGLPIDSPEVLSLPAVVSLESAPQLDGRDRLSRFSSLLQFAPAHASPVVVLVLDHERQPATVLHDFGGVQFDPDGFVGRGVSGGGETQQCQTGACDDFHSITSKESDREDAIPTMIVALHRLCHAPRVRHLRRFR